ncbi:aldo/keto reductase [Paenibacillus sp. IB182496]|uniref:Aldo/keto reductase n=1 Tax=Paenibacillus sabuli TaxID=2772509 RepID=A0A927BV95_9BACL|nr:aldo/keto reductase [Paenibacillus sabuli]MBD2846982.1 aldo/keto reductase [Paenibacillus sabuli]
MRKRKLGNTGIEVSPIAVGCWAFAGGKLWGDQDEAESAGAVHAALDAGLQFFDTAEGYGDGHSEEVLGRALLGRREQAVIATKVSPGHLAKAEVIAACERSLRRLQTDYIDLYQVHWPNREVPLSETLEALTLLEQQGKIRAAGVCNFGAVDLGEALQHRALASNQIIYSLLWRAVEYEVQPLCEQEGVGLLCYSPLAQGLLGGKYTAIDQFPEERMRTKHFASSRAAAPHHEPGLEAETFAAVRAIAQLCEEIGQPMNKVALAWLLHQPGVASVLGGVRNREQALSNAAAASLELSPDFLRRLDAITAEVKQGLGPDLDFTGYRVR